MKRIGDQFDERSRSDAHYAPEMIDVGQAAPEFEARRQDGETATLAGFLERGPLVLYFYPKDFTPG